MPDENTANTPEETPAADASAGGDAQTPDVMPDDAMAAAMRAAIDDDPAKQEPAAEVADTPEAAAENVTEEPTAEDTPAADEDSQTPPEDDAADTALPPGAEKFTAPDVSRTKAPTAATSIDLLDDVELDVKIELGRAEMYIEDVLELGPGSVVKLDKAAGDPVDIFVNERLVARGEVLVLNDNFCVRINDILSPIPEA